jgi:hypothetical protein
VHLVPEFREHCCLVPRSRTDVQHALVALERQRLADPGDHVRLGDRLAEPDRQGRVVVGAVANLLGDEKLARHSLHRLEHSLVDDVAAAQLSVDHSEPLVDSVRPHGRAPRRGGA